MFEVTRDPLEPQPLLDFVRKDESGAIVSFYGVVRGSSEGRRVLHLEYDAYVPMAVKEMQKIGDDLRSRWQITEVAMRHRRWERSALLLPCQPRTGRTPSLPVTTPSTASKRLCRSGRRKSGRGERSGCKAMRSKRGVTRHTPSSKRRGAVVKNTLEPRGFPWPPFRNYSATAGSSLAVDRTFSKQGLQ